MTTPNNAKHKPWNEMSPRERDALVAEKVMKLQKELISINGVINSPYNPGTIIREIDHYTTDIKAAWEVIEKLHDKGFAIQIVDGVATGYHTVNFYNASNKQYWTDGAETKSIPEAICLAALRAVGVEI